MSTATHRVANSLAGVVVGLMVAATLVGCSADRSTEAVEPTAAPEPEQTFNDVTGASEEYDAATVKYALPDGVTYPPAPFTDPDGQYQAGYGEGRVVFFWNCAWAKSYLAKQGVDEVGAAAALEQYASVRDTDTFKLNWDPVSIQQPFEAAVEAAELGDPSAIQKDADINCTQ